MELILERSSEHKNILLVKDKLDLMEEKYPEAVEKARQEMNQEITRRVNELQEKAEEEPIVRATQEKRKEIILNEEWNKFAEFVESLE